MQVYHLVDDEGLFSDDRNKEKYLKQLIDEWISCDLKFGFSNQEKDIKKLSASIKGQENNLINQYEFS